jgi:hypothetical protein
VLEEEFNIVGNDEAAFDRSLGIDTENWRASENWQILSATRIQPYGTDELNRVIQSRFRAKMLSMARDNRSTWPRPFGDQEIVWPRLHSNHGAISRLPAAHPISRE